MATFVVLWGQRRRFSDTVKFVQDEYKLAVSGIEKKVIEYIETSIVFKQDQPSLRELLLPALEEFANSPDDKEIVILGADRLRPSWHNFSKLQEKSIGGQFDKPEHSIEFRYGLVFNGILGRASDKILKRYIYLFRPQDLQGRTKDFRENYLAWLEDQANYFRQNENYVIISTPRATVWGAPKSIIFFLNSMVEVFFQGGGILTTSRSDSTDIASVVPSMRRLLINEYVDRKITGLARTEYSQLNLSTFEEYIGKIRMEVRQGVTHIQSLVIFTETRHAMRELLLPEFESFFNSSDKEIIILGADQLRPSIAGFSILKEKVKRESATSEEELEFKYGSIFNEILAGSSDLPDSPDPAHSSNKVLLRYIYLFRAQDLQGRTADFRDAYLAWLKDQESFIRVTSNYTILNTPRATVWGAPKSIIFFRNNMVEIFFRGGGIVMSSQIDSDDSVISDTKRFLIDEYVNDKAKGPQQTIYNQGNLPEFRKYVQDIQEEVNKENKQ